MRTTPAVAGRLALRRQVRRGALGGGMPFLHLHRSYEEAFYLIEGEVEFQLGSEEVRAIPGSAVLVPPGTPHCFRNVGEGEADWIVITTRRWRSRGRQMTDLSGIAEVDL